MRERNTIDPANWLSQVSFLLHIRTVKGTIAWANSAAANKFNWHDASWENPIDAQDLEQVRFALAVTSTSGNWLGDLKRKGLNGDETTLESHWSPIRDENNELRGIFVMEFDVSEKRLTDANVVRAQRMESIGTLAGGVAHDINNVLGPILIGAEMIRKKVHDPWVQKKLESIEASARRGADIVKQVMNLSQGATGEKIPVQVRYLLNELVAFTESTFRKSIEIQHSVPSDLPLILGDAPQIRQCILNLMVNGMDAMPNGGVISIAASTVVISESQAAECSVNAQSGHFLKIEVSDTGSGIPDAISERIFEPFYTTKTRQQGTGLGLPTSRSIVEGHGGFVTARNNSESAGATFSVFIPTIQGPIIDANVKTADTFSQSKNLGAKTILIVDDEPLMLEMNIDMLESFEFQTHSAENGKVGLDTYCSNSEQIDLIVTDIDMPVMDGYEMIREIKKINPSMPIIAVSGLSDSKYKKEDLGASNIWILGKPYSSTDLIKLVNEALREASESSFPGKDANILPDSDFDALMDGLN